ncbi:MAG: response regulator [Candidatus Omnitrophica bacterium]|nr:response regulator [Candidatus Omnitrophota bacterium]
MSKRTVLILEKEKSPWLSFLEEFFEETPVKPHTFTYAPEIGAYIDRHTWDIAFINPELLSLALAQKLRVFRQSSPETRIFQLGEGKRKDWNVFFDAVFSSDFNSEKFLNQIVQHLPFPDVLRVLIVDDEPEIGAMLRDFLDQRVRPAFEVEYAENGRKGLEAIAGKTPDVLILDIKMPVMDGREVYRTIKQKGLAIPVIIFFDAISWDEMMEIRKYGNPSVVEKSSNQSSVPAMMALIKKMAYFG